MDGSFWNFESGINYQWFNFRGDPEGILDSGSLWNFRYHCVKGGIREPLAKRKWWRHLANSFALAEVPAGYDCFLVFFVPLLYVCIAWKGHPRNDLYCVGWDVKPYSLTQSCFSWANQLDSFGNIQPGSLQWRVVMLNIWTQWLGSLTVMCRTCNPEVTQGRRFDSALGHCRVTTLDKLFTHMCLCHQAV